MKVNTNPSPEKDPAAKKNRRKQKPAAPVQTDAAGSENVYKEAFAAYRKKWSENGGPLHQNKFWIGVLVILFLVFLSVNSNMNNRKMQLTLQLNHVMADTENLNQAISEVKADLEEQAKIDAVKLTQEEEELAKNNAVEQGTLVAKMQNLYRDLDLDTDYDAFTNNKNALDACFGPNDKNARTEWYSSLSGIPGTWEFASKAAFRGNTAKVLWLCYADEDHTLLAYCMATYHADTKLFTDVDWKMTSYALSHIKTDGETETPTEQVTSVEEMLKGITGEVTTPDASEDFSQETIDTNNDISDTRDSYKQDVANGDVEGEEYDSNYNVGLGNSADTSDEETEPDEQETESDDTKSDKPNTDDSVSDEPDTNSDEGSDE